MPKGHIETPPRSKEPDVIRSRSPEVARAEEEIERTRERVASSVMALREKVAEQVDWREWVRRRPGTFLAGAFVIGFMWGQRRR